ncbi:MAG: GerAB/ArcD/ProY family transporter [Candidatus Pacearchaeota archaeon]|nr:MAG: GerAB/ArcD/ProY family transporter [Candidatus Pacearchaeota archaeon]
MKKGISTAEAIATLVGMIIGAGILGIPYVIAQAGLFWGLVNIIGIGLIVLLVYLYLGEVILRTKGKHQLPGYASLYLGKAGRILMLISMLLVQYGALIAYMFGEGEVLSFIFLGTVPLSSHLMFSVIFLAMMAVFVFFGLKTLGKGELIGLGAIIVIVIAIAVYFLPQVQVINFMSSNPNLTFRFFFPFGAVLFAYLGFAAVPEMNEILKNKKKMKKAIIIGGIIPIAVYLLFTITVIGFKGIATPEIATMALGKFVSLFAVFTMFTSFLAVGIAQKEIFWYDLKFKHFMSWLLTFLPVLLITLLIIFFNLVGFIGIISFAGAVGGGIAGILIMLMAIRAKKLGQRKPEYTVGINWLVAGILILLFALGILYQFMF